MLGNTIKTLNRQIVYMLMNSCHQKTGRSLPCVQNEKTSSDLSSMGQKMVRVSLKKTLTANYLKFPARKTLLK